jgi:hypothetical protein
MAGSIFDLNNNKEDVFGLSTKELDSQVSNHISAIKSKAKALRDEILQGGNNDAISRSLDKLNETVFWATYARTR